MASKQRNPWSHFLFFSFIVISVPLSADVKKTLRALSLPNLITRKNSTLPLHWMIQAPAGVTVVDCASGKRITRSGPNVLVRADRKGLWVDGKACQGTDIRIMPVIGSMQINGNERAKSLRVWCDTRTAKIAMHRADPLHKERQYALDTPICTVAEKAVPTVSQLARQFPVRVLLRELEPGNWKISSDTGFMLRSERKKYPRRVKEMLVLPITVREKTVLVEGYTVPPDGVLIRPQTGRLQFDGRTYEGAFRIVRDGNRALLINVLGLEEYVYSVLKTEGWPGWPLEINKVLAIASRTYALAMIERARKTKHFYHVGCTNAHQTYSGVHDTAVIRQAVEETRGIFLSHEDHPILAMFDSCCGGVIPANIEEFDFTNVPYLARPYACRHCKHLRVYSWKADLTLAEFERKIRSHITDLDKVRHATIAKRDKAGLAQEVALKDGKRKVTLSGQKLYALLPEVKSFCFDIEKNADTVTLKGRGFGHHVGLCQWGAREMVREGWNHLSILRFYYPDTRVSRVV